MCKQSNRKQTPGLKKGIMPKLFKPDIRDIKIHVYAKLQTSDSSWELLRIENKQIKSVQNNSYA